MIPQGGLESIADLLGWFSTGLLAECETSCKGSDSFQMGRGRVRRIIGQRRVEWQHSPILGSARWTDASRSPGTRSNPRCSAQKSAGTW
eukprot:9491310-Pyramimonas_sp.AAC.1